MNKGEPVSTGFKKLDEILGGGVIPDSLVLFVHETYSWGWLLAFGLLANRIQMGDFGVILNSVLPISSLKIELNPVGISIDQLGESGNLLIVDMFASIMGINYNSDFILKLDNVSPETFVPKYSNLYMNSIYPRIQDKRAIGLDFTLDGLALIMGETNTIRIFQRFMALKENSRLTKKTNRPINLLVLNKDRVSKNFLSWFSLYSQYVIETIPRTNIAEKIVIRKSPLVYTQQEEALYLKRKKGRIVIE